MNSKIVFVVAVLAVGIGAYMLFYNKERNVSTSELSKVSELSDSDSDINLVAGNFFFDPSSDTVEVGNISLSVGKVEGFHTFVIDELGVKESLSEGKTFSFEASAGTYEYYCDVPGHRERGMFGTLTVN